MTPQATLIPYVIQKSANGERSYDLFSRLLNDRIVMLTEEITDATAASVVGQLLYLQSEDPKKDISLYINSPGGSISAGLAIYDTMQHISCDVNTIGMGMCASMAAVILAAGEKGKRYVLPNTEVMIHQPLGGAKGQATEIEIVAAHILRTKQRMNEIMAKHTGHTPEEIQAATDRDNYLLAEEAKDFGLIDHIL